MPAPPEFIDVHSQLLFTLQNSSQTRVRLFRESDTERVREIFMQGNVYNPNSPAYIALKRQLRKPFTIVLFGTFALGLALFSYSAPARVPGALLSLVSLALFLVRRQIMWSTFTTYSQDVLDTDMADIKKHYETRPSAFWVAEIADGTQAGTIVGCVGLHSTAQNPSIGEVKRLAVDPMYQKQRVGRILMANLLDHARASGISTITLHTTMYHTGALYMYERLGFTKGKKVWVPVMFLFTVDTLYLQPFTLDLRSEKRN